MENELLIMSGHLAAIGMFAAKKDIRYYLQGICIDTSSAGTFIVATCGHTLAVHQIDTVAREAGQFIMPLSSLTTMLKANRKSTVKLTLPDGFAGKYDASQRVKRQVTIDALKSEISIVVEMDGIFPDWRRVAQYDDAPYPNQVFFNPEYLVRVADAANLISARKFAVQVRPGGTGVGFATLDHEGKTVAYVMPMSTKTDDLPSKPNMTFTVTQVKTEVEVEVTT
jgi:DNA polymerase-3 subunit beta